MSNTNVLFNAAAGGAVTGDEYYTNDRGLRTFVVDITSTGTVTVQGRNNPDDSWITIKEDITASEGFFGAVFPRMRVVIANGGGDIRVSVDAQMRQVS